MTTRWSASSEGVAAGRKRGGGGRGGAGDRDDYKVVGIV